MDQDLINRIVEAALLAANQPLTLAQLHALFPEDQPAPNGAVEQALETLREGCDGRGVELVELASGFRYQVKADVHPWVARLWTERQTKYTRATLETLALIAYRQPITRGEIEQVRGVAVNSNIIKALEEREWIRVVGHRDVPGKPALFGTTKAFLDYFGLKRLDELPPLSELKDIGELEPQLQFENVIDPTPIEAGGIGAEAGVEAGVDAGIDAEADAQNPGTTAGDHPVAARAPDENADQDDELDDQDDLAASENEDDRSEGTTDAATAGHEKFAEGNDAAVADDSDDNEDENDYASDGDPEAAPGVRAADENERESDISSEDLSVDAEMGGDIDSDPFPDNAVEMTTVPMTDDDAEALAEEQASSEQETND